MLLMSIKNCMKLLLPAAVKGYKILETMFLSVFIQQNISI